MRIDQLIAAAIIAATEKSLALVKRSDIAAVAGVTESLVTYYLGDPTQYRTVIAREAVARRVMPIVAELVAMPAHVRPDVEISDELIALSAEWMRAGGRYAAVE